jgi:hypothetical protein
MGGGLAPVEVELFLEFEVFLLICIHLLRLIDSPALIGHVFIRRMTAQSWVNCWLKVEKVGGSHEWIQKRGVKGVEMRSGIKGVEMGSGAGIEDFLVVFFATLVQLFEHQIGS